ncbi:hypothetical protein PNEG_02664 [Pneumocystis murina B123]|uniref:Rho-GAP domain-containing protein n=1 Tax=Pneumocystis murina (strain B123) TaxID=1069680 RepID=M7PEI7_PNEMU|nr:hypothetical protein PNEG_02664 [Pneumocystis murina B123]EMR08879.1 hypothetical protein PNEG_02664 [Pneumocystis murina B123]
MNQLKIKDTSIQGVNKVYEDLRNESAENLIQKKQFTGQEKEYVSQIPTVIDSPLDFKDGHKLCESSVVSDTTVSSLVNNFGNDMHMLVQQMMKEKISLHTQNMQLWKIIDKQRAMILELQKDLEKAFKEKKKYYNLWTISSKKKTPKNVKEIGIAQEVLQKVPSNFISTPNIRESQKKTLLNESQSPNIENSEFSFIHSEDRNFSVLNNTSDDCFLSTVQPYSKIRNKTLSSIPQEEIQHLTDALDQSKPEKSSRRSPVLTSKEQGINLVYNQSNITIHTQSPIYPEEISTYKKFNITYKNLDSSAQDLNISDNSKNSEHNKPHFSKYDEINQSLELNKDKKIKNEDSEMPLSVFSNSCKPVSASTGDSIISLNASQNCKSSLEQECQFSSSLGQGNSIQDPCNKSNKNNYPKNLEIKISQENILLKQDNVKAYESDLNSSASIGLVSKTNPNSHEDYLDKIGQAFDTIALNEENTGNSLCCPSGSSLYLPCDISSISLKILNSKLRMGKNKEEIFFSIGIFQNTEKKKELWRVEKSVQKILDFDDKLRRILLYWKIPDINSLNTQSTTRVDQRKALLDQYLKHILSVPLDESAYSLLNDFLNTDIEIQTKPQILYAKQNTIDEECYNEYDTGPCDLIKKEGYLTKRGKNFGGWKSRYFVLDGPILKYYETRDGIQLGSIRLSQAQIGRQQLQPYSNLSFESHPDISYDDNSYRHAFLILEPKRNYSSSFIRHVLCAKSDKDCDEWVQALMQYVDINISDNFIMSTNTEKKERKNFFRKHSILADTARHSVSALANINAYQMLNNELRTTPENTKSNIGKLEESNYIENNSFSSPIHNLKKNISVDFTSNLSNDLFGSSKIIQTAENSLNNIKPYESNLSGNYISDELLKLDKKFKKKGFWSFVNKDVKQKPLESMSQELQTSSSNNDLNTHTLNYNFHNIFGVPLSEAVYISRLSLEIDIMIPSVVYRCIEYLDNNNAEKEEGIYRLSGSNTIIKSLKDKFNAEGDVDLLNSGKCYDVHAIAGLLKLYLRELPTNILTRELHSQFLSAIDIQDTEKRTDALNKLVRCLPEENFCLLRVLINHLYRIVAHANLNKMTCHNVGIVFSPTVNIPAGIFSQFLIHYDIIFEDQSTSTTFPPSLDQ